ncbi:MAG TPA: rhodanese-like domain-containing protein [Anaerolineales bacterium]|nr:rhodanese-like domain-containing protein [Anaerolineales bacterium]
MFRTILLFLLLVGLAACSSATAPDTGEVGQGVTVPGGSYTDVSVPELQTMLANKDFTFVNVHIPFEGDIASTDLSIAFDEIGQNLEQLPADKDAKIVLYCRSDRMSRIAAETLVGLGYTNVWNLDGGMVAWEQAGSPLER